MQATSPAAVDPSGRPPITFSFGENWKAFLGTMSDGSVAGALADIEGWLGTASVAGKRVLDIGCGSGIHSLCFHRLAAAEVRSIDVDPHSVEATRSIWERAGRPANWRVDHGSVLDDAFVAGLGQWDIVYAWGVLHHTGAMWTAVEHACRCVAPGGLYWIALYAAGPQYAADLALKQRYNRSGRLGKRLMEGRWIARLMRGRLRAGKNPFGWNQKQPRGMDTYHDLVDWLGGLPYEVASVHEVEAFCRRHGFARVRVDEQPEGACSIYLFRKDAVPPGT